MNGNTVKANPLPSIAQPQDVQLDTNQLLGHVGTGITGVSLVGTNGINVKSDGKNTLTIEGSNAGDSVPIGTIIFFADSTPPAGWFECNGQSLSKANYLDLFNVIDYTYGGSGNTFNLPDLRGQFVRGWDHGLGVDSGRSFGSKQNDQFQKFDLSAETGVVPGSAVNIVMQLQNGRGYNTGSTGGNGIFTDGDGWSTTPSSYTKVTPVNANVGSETRPKNVALLPCIKYATNQTLNNFGLSAQQVLNAVNNIQPSYTGFRNKIINGDMRIDQRSAGNPYTVANSANAFYGSIDRWFFQSMGSSMAVQQVVTAWPGTKYAIAMTGGAGNTYTAFGQRIESSNCYDLVEKTVTLSFKAQSNGASINTQVVATYAQGANDAYTEGGGIGFFASNYTITNTLQTFTFTFTVPSNGANGIAIYPVDSFPLLAGQTIYISEVQLEEGSIATPFEHRPIGTELALCQRYYEKSYNLNVKPGTNTNIGIYHIYPVSNNYSWCIPFRASKRTNPTVTGYAIDGTVNKFSVYNTTTPGTNQSLVTPINAVSENNFITATVTVASQTDGYLQWTADAEL